MSTRSKLWGLPAALALLVLGCNTISQTVTGPDIDLDNGQGGPSASPSPGSSDGSLPAGSTVRVGLFGQSCPSGTQAPNNGSRQIIQGCTGFLTATPKDASGNDLSPAIHGPNCSWTSSGAITLSDAGNPFNKDARCPNVGEATAQALVKNVTGSVGLSCLPGPARSSAVSERVYFWTSLATPELQASAIARDQARYGR